MNLRMFVFVCAALMLSASLMQRPSYAAGSPIALSTTLLTVDARARTATVSLANRTDTPQRYRVSVIDMQMRANGEVKPVAEGEKSHAQSAREWVIATPSSITLEPGASQNIRLLIRRPKGLTDGEYRAHLLVSQEPPADINGGLKDRADAASKGLDLNIVTVYSTSIPIVVLQGQTESRAALADAAFSSDGKQLHLAIACEGNASFRGFVMLENAGSQSAVLPITIYPEVAMLERDYAVEVGAQAGGEVKLTLYAGEVPRPGEPMGATALESRTLSLP